MRYGIITDIHNNIIALRAVLKRLDQLNCDRIICCGDIIGIGPCPEETVQELAAIPGLMSIRGNHEGYLLEGMPSKYPNDQNMDPGEMEHHRWEHALLSDGSISFLRDMPYRIDFASEGFDITVIHSCMDRNGHFSGSKKDPTESDLQEMFASVDSDIILYGHDHARNICRSDKLYINVGSLGCPAKDLNIARAGVLRIENGKADIETVDVVYDVDEVVHQIDTIAYPQADIIKKVFYGL